MATYFIVTRQTVWRNFRVEADSEEEAQHLVRVGDAGFPVHEYYAPVKYNTYRE